MISTQQIAQTSTNTPELSELQYWFLTVMTAAGGVAQGLELAQQRTGWAAEQVINGQHGAALTRRMQVYSDGYVLRLLECLQTDYPVLQKVMGEELFNFFAKAYIWQQPSTSPTLYDLGAAFGNFLLASQHAAPPHMRNLLLLPIELARLERARSEAVRAPGTERHASTASPLDLLLGDVAHVATAPCLRLLQLQMPLLAFWQSVSRGEDIPATPDPAPSFVAVTRKHYRVQMMALETWQYAFLQALQGTTTQAPTAFQQALESGAQAATMSVDQMLASLLSWLPIAEHAGLITRTA